MKFNTKTRYGVRVVLELALNADLEGGTFQKEIAESQHVSIKYLDHIIASHKKAGLINNIGGKKADIYFPSLPMRSQYTMSIRHLKLTWPL